MTVQRRGRSAFNCDVSACRVESSADRQESVYVYVCVCSLGRKRWHNVMLFFPHSVPGLGGLSGDQFEELVGAGQVGQVSDFLNISGEGIGAN